MQQLAYNFIDVPAGFATSSLGISGGLFNDFSTIIYMFIGVILFGALVYFLIGAFHKH